MKTPKIGILGGTFDPVHLAHLLIAQEAYEQLGLDRVWFMPSYISPHKKGRETAPTADRLKMLQLAVADDRRFKVSDVEISSGGISYTAITLRKLGLQKQQKKLYLIVGSDTLKLLPTWREPDQIVGLCRIAVVERPGLRLTPTDLRSRGIARINMPLLEISSSEVRKRVKLGKSIAYWVPKKVEDYIAKRKLYSNSSS